MTKLADHLKRLVSDRRGNVAIIFGIASLPVVGLMGAAVDYSRSHSLNAVIQSAADAAALAGAIIITNDDEQRKAEARKMFVGTLKEPLKIQPTVTTDQDKITVSGEAKVPTSFLGIMGIEEVTIRASATATSVKGPPICVLGLSQNASPDISVRGQAKVTAEKCAVHSNSGNSQALKTEGEASATAAKFCAVGGHSGTGFSPTPTNGCPKVVDPLANLPTPVISNCNHQNLVLKAVHIATPGTYCGGLLLESGAIVSFQPGVYVIRDGKLSVKAASTMIGTGVTFYFYGNNATLEIKSHAIVDVSAPKSGPYAGVAFAQHAGSSVGLSALVEGGGILKIVGALYFPSQVFEVAGEGLINSESPYMPVVADRLVFRGNATIRVSADHSAAGFGNWLPHVYEGARLIY